jgi:hypothetical protein
MAAVPARSAMGGGATVFATSGAYRWAFRMAAFDITKWHYVLPEARNSNRLASGLKKFWAALAAS